jgi:glyoxylase-like metal-dependent hydrolase (beta-lactamase superfamily II)
MSRTAEVHRVAGTRMAVNAYVVEGAEGLVVVDGMLTVSDALAVRTRIAALKKPVLGAIVTHAHPDHYAGMSEILRGLDVPIVSTQAVRETIVRDDATKDAIVGPMMAAEWPAMRVFPNRDLASGSTVEFGDLLFRVDDVGPAESPADSTWTLGEHAIFVGDLVYAGMHAYLADGYAAEWLACIDRLERSTASDTTLYVGHGAPGSKALFETQRRYITTFTASVAQNLEREPEARRAAVVADMKRLLPSDDLAFLMELSIDPFAAKLSPSRSPR